MTTFTICIPCVDKHIEQMEKTLDSIQYYTLKPNKVIVSISPRYLNINLYDETKRLEQKFPFLKCLVQDKPTGIGENINHTFKYVDTDYVTIWGADDFFHPQYFEILNNIIEKYNPSIITHSFKKGIKEKSNDLNVFEKINLENIKIYNNLYLMHEGEDMYRFFSQKWMQYYKMKNYIWMHYGMQTFKSHIIKENKYKEGPKYDWKSDTLFLNEAFRKYGKMIFIDENMVHYVASNTNIVIH